MLAVSETFFQIRHCQAILASKTVGEEGREGHQFKGKREGEGHRNSLGKGRGTIVVAVRRGGGEREGVVAR
jgi:hypothetical protein